MFHVFFLFFSAAIRHIAQSGIYFRRIIPAWLLPASHNQSYCLPPSILLPHTINPTASHNQSYSLPQSILLPPTINPPASHNQSSYLPQSILLPPTINPTAFWHQSYGLPQSILRPPTINPTASRHILSPLLCGFPSLCAVICLAVTPIPVITSLAIYALRSTKALPANMARE